MASGKSKFFFTIIFIAAFCSGAVCFLNKDRLEFPVTNSIQLNSPYIVRDHGDLRYILDNQRMRIVVVEKESNVVRCVLPNGSKEEDTFYYADDFMVDEDGNVYVKEGAWDGNRISREAILVYDSNGRYVETCMDMKHDRIINKHKFMLLSVGGGKIDKGKNKKRLFF